MIKMSKNLFITITIIACFVFVVLIRSNYLRKESNIHVILSPSEQSNSPINKKQNIIEGFSDGHNSTHLWSMPLADENYLRRARLLPCRNVSYGNRRLGGKINTCDESPANEFSLENLLQGQKWLYDHQHPSNCSDQRFAIIQRFAPSGFGSTVHQIAWAFGVALAENRIAVYETPGKWVR